MASWFQCFTGGQPIHEQQQHQQHQQHQLGQYQQQLRHSQATAAAFDDTVGPYGGALSPLAAKVLVSVSSQTDAVQQLYQQQQQYPGYHVGELGTGRAHAEADQEGAMELGTSSILPNVLSQHATALSGDNLQRALHGGSAKLTASGSLRTQPQPLYSSEIQGAGSLSLPDSSAYGSPGGSVSRLSEGLAAGRLTPKPDPAASIAGSQYRSFGPDLPRSSETEDSSCIGGSTSRLSEDDEAGSRLGKAIFITSQVAAVQRVVAADAARQARLTQAELSQVVDEEADAVGELGINLNVNWDRQIKLGRVIGSGNYGVVHEAWYRGRRVAVKCLSKVGVNAASTKEDLDIFRGEMKIMVRLHHPNIVCCYGGNLTPPRVFLVQEIMCCNLFNYIYHPDADVSLRVLLCIARDIAMGLTYLHPTVLHRDLKPANILLGQHGVAKISDFGLARSKERTFLTTKTLEAGTVPYMAPECFNVSITHLSDRCDVYSLAVVIWELLVRAPPWHGMRDLAVAYAVTVDEKRLPMPASDRCPPRLDKLISACWQTEPLARPCAAEVVAELDVLLTELGGPPSQLCK